MINLFLHCDKILSLRWHVRSSSTEVEDGIPLWNWLLRCQVSGEGKGNPEEPFWYGIWDGILFFFRWAVKEGKNRVGNKGIGPSFFHSSLSFYSYPRYPLRKKPKHANALGLWLHQRWENTHPRWQPRTTLYRTVLPFAQTFWALRRIPQRWTLIEPLISPWHLAVKFALLCEMTQLSYWFLQAFLFLYVEWHNWKTTFFFVKFYC